MQKKNIYIGNINIVENKIIKLYQNNCPLLSLEDGNYINLEWISSLKDYLEFYKGFITGTYNKKLIISSKIPQSGIYIDENSLIPYYNDNKKKRISINKVNQDIILDSRIPRGIDYQVDGTKLIYIRKKNPRK